MSNVTDRWATRNAAALRMEWRMGVFWARATILELSRLRATCATVFPVAFACTEIGRFPYHPYARRARLNDVGIANTMGNSLAMIAQIFCLLACRIARHPDELKANHGYMEILRHHASQPPGVQPNE